eukprot:Transcript_13569.p2 GENE.Transcript_13569~~Transcript_13569.p2  ORF type:complete len:326 (-),score=157.78 Transcript_13569:436-1413(-)
MRCSAPPPTPPPPPMWKVTGDAGKRGAAAGAGSAEAEGEEEEEGAPLEAPTPLDDGALAYSFGRLRFVQYEAKQLSETRVQQRIVHRLQALVLAHRAKLERAYQAAEQGGAGGAGGATGLLPAHQWAEVTQQVLGITVPLMQLRVELLGAEAAARASGGGAGAGVDYRAYLARHQLVNPGLEPLYRVHEYLLALMYRAERGERRPAAAGGSAPSAPAAGGTLPMRAVETVCQIMGRHFGEEAALCRDAPTLMGALGEAGAEFARAGEVSIDRVAEQFALVPQEGDDRPGILSLLHRLNRHYIQALGGKDSSIGISAEEFSRSSSC